MGRAVSRPSIMVGEPTPEVRQSADETARPCQLEPVLARWNDRKDAWRACIALCIRRCASVLRVPKLDRFDMRQCALGVDNQHASIRSGIGIERFYVGLRWRGLRRRHLIPMSADVETVIDSDINDLIADGCASGIGGLD